MAVENNTAVRTNRKRRSPPAPQLIRETPCVETIAMLTELLEMARGGQLIGLALVGICKQRQIQPIVTGEASRNPVFALGAVRLLEQAIVQQVMGEG